jgi:hypothetical protein
MHLNSLAFKLNLMCIKLSLMAEHKKLQQKQQPPSQRPDTPNPEENDSAPIVGLVINGIKPINRPITSVGMTSITTGTLASRKTLLTWLLMIPAMEQRQAFNQVWLWSRLIFQSGKECCLCQYFVSCYVKQNSQHPSTQGIH